MASKIQVPAIGGLRKVVKIPTTTAGTTIAEYGSGTITLAQLKAALGVTTTSSAGGNVGAPGSGNTGATSSGSNAPIPVFLFSDDGEGDGGGSTVPGPPGAAGPSGAGGPAGPAVYLEAEPGEDGIWAIPGPQGPAGVRTVNKGATWVSSTAIVAGSAPLVFVSCPVAGTITKVKVVTAGGTGSCVIDIWKAPFASFPPVVGNSITASAKPTISSGVTYSDSTLTGWTTAVNAGDVLAFSLTSSSTFTEITIVLEVQQ